MRFRKETARYHSALDITPIVDTVFNLLIFFALSLNFISTPGIQVNLPQSTAQEVQRERKDLRVVITSADRIFLNEKEVDLAALGKGFKESAAVSLGIQVLVQADEQVTHGKVVEVMDLARNAGLTRLAIVTKAKENPKR